MGKQLALVFALAFTLLATGCGEGSFGSALGPVPTSQPTGSASPASPTAGATGSSTSVDSATPIDSSGAPTPTVTPVPGSIGQGTASLVVSGDLQTTQSAIPLSTPPIYALPPGSFALNWQTAAAGVALAGPTFVGTKPTSDVMRLSFFVHASSGTYQFVSTNGVCLITVAQADPTIFSGTFTCDAMSDTGGTITVAAQGALLASG